MARPTKLTPEVKARFLSAIQLGAPYEMACWYGGITYRTLRNWIKKGEEAKSGEFFTFLQDVKKAEGIAVAGWLAKIEKAANDGIWTAAAWKLERRYPHQFGRTVVEHEGDSDRNIHITNVIRTIVELPTDKLQAFVEREGARLFGGDVRTEKT